MQQGEWRHWPGGQLVVAVSTADGETGGHFRPIGGFPPPSPHAQPPVRGLDHRERAAVAVRRIGERALPAPRPVGEEAEA